MSGRRTRHSSPQRLVTRIKYIWTLVHRVRVWGPAPGTSISSLVAFSGGSAEPASSPSPFCGKTTRVWLIRGRRWPDALTQSLLAVLASRQMRFKCGNTLRLQVPGVVHFEIVFVNMNSIVHGFLRTGIFLLRYRPRLKCFMRSRVATSIRELRRFWVGRSESSRKSESPKRRPKSFRPSRASLPVIPCSRIARRLGRLDQVEPHQLVRNSGKNGLLIVRVRHFFRHAAPIEFPLAFQLDLRFALHNRPLVRAG